MKTILIALLFVFALSTQVFATGSCVLTSVENIRTLPSGDVDRKYLTITCTGDAGGIAAYNINPTTLGIRGWYLYNVSTNPGSSAPTALYDITLVVDGEDVANGLLNNRSDTATETVVINSSPKGYPMMDGTMVLTHTNTTANPATIVETFRFTRN